VLLTHAYATTGTFTVVLTVQDAAGNTDSDTATVSVSTETPPQDTVPPSANAGSDLSGTVNTPLTFNGSGSSDNIGVISYIWDFGDGSQGTGVAPNHVYSNEGKYAVSLTVYDLAGNSGVDTASVTITTVPDNTPPLAIAGEDRFAEIFSAVMFDGSNSYDNTGITSFSWNFGDGETSTETSPTHSYNYEGEFVVNLTVQDATGNKDTDTLTVTVKDTPPSIPADFLGTPGEQGIYLAWDMQQGEEDVRGYKVYYGLQAENYISSVDVGKTSKYEVKNLNKNVTYYLTISAYDVNGNESPLASNLQIRYTGIDEIPPSSPEIIE